MTIIGRECVPINPKISVWPYVSKPSISRSEFGDHGPPLTVVAFWSGRGQLRPDGFQIVRINPLTTHYLPATIIRSLASEAVRND